MPNKFQKSVMDRLEQEAALQRRKTKDVEVPAAVPGVGEAEAANTEPDVKIPEPPLAPSDISGYIRREPQRLAKNKTFYLDADVIDAVKKNAAKEKVTDSRLVNDVLRRVLGI